MVQRVNYRVILVLILYLNFLWHEFYAIHSGVLSINLKKVIMEQILKDNLTGTNQGKLYPNLPLRYLTASSVIGDKVANNKGENLGEVKDIMLDLIRRLESGVHVLL